MIDNNNNEFMNTYTNKSHKSNLSGNSKGSKYTTTTTKTTTTNKSSSEIYNMLKNKCIEHNNLSEKFIINNTNIMKRLKTKLKRIENDYEDYTTNNIKKKLEKCNLSINDIECNTELTTESSSKVQSQSKLLENRLKKRKYSRNI